MTNELIPIRLSHLLSHSGVGAIVRGEDGTMVVKDIRFWTDINGNIPYNKILYVDRLKQELGINQDLIEPPIAKRVKDRNNKERIDGICIPALRFPSWARCPACNFLYERPWRKNQTHCNQQNCKNKRKLEQIIWVLADPKGYLSDAPWHFLAHRKPKDINQANCNIYDLLTLTDRGNMLDIHCKKCGANSSISKVGERILFKVGERMQPWTKDNVVPPDGPSVDFENQARILAINDSQLYLPNDVVGLIIPPESRAQRDSVLDRLYRSTQARDDIKKSRNKEARKAAINRAAKSSRCKPEDIESALIELERGYPLYGENFTTGQLRESEFKAFLKEYPDQREDEDMVTHNRSQAWQEQAKRITNSTLQWQINGISHLVRVDKLKAVKIFKGFSRIDGKSIMVPDIIGESSWLPAVELYGEGIFIVLNEQRLRVWEHDPAVRKRIEQLMPRFVQSGRDNPNPLTPRHMLLHTLSHLLMRQIETESGYPAASLVERLYCSEAPEPMAGILIYVAVPDIAGSLGGLAELAEPERFQTIFSRALEHARWCSLDPVCSEHEGQGPGLLNRAACHACCLVPEPACDYANTLLDRSFVKGDSDSALPAFFDTP